MSEPRFLLGRTVATPGALAAISANNQIPLEFFMRHSEGDWGDLESADKAENERSIEDEARILSAYNLRDGTRIYVITEADRSATTILLPEEY
jgi:hypothetical protein